MKHMTYKNMEQIQMKKCVYNFPSWFIFDFAASIFPSLRSARGQNMWEDNGTIKVLSGFLKRKTKQYVWKKTKVVSQPENRVMIAPWLSSTFTPNSKDH